MPGIGPTLNVLSCALCNCILTQVTEMSFVLKSEKYPEWKKLYSSAEGG